MSNESIDHNTVSRLEWDHLEDLLSGQVQGLIQYMLEEEVTEFLGRVKSARRSDSDTDSGYRNGYAPPRRGSRAGCCRCSPAGPAGSPI